MKYLKIYIYLILILLIYLVSNIDSKEKEYKYISDINEINYNFNKIESYAEQEQEKESFFKTIETFYGNMTGYDPNCYGCSGITASGLNVLNTNSYYDNYFGSINIVAGDSSLPFGTIVKFSNLNNYEDFTGIVLDRGSAIGKGKTSQFDLLFNTYNEAINFGFQENIKFEILRLGF